MGGGEDFLGATLDAFGGGHGGNDSSNFGNNGGMSSLGRSGNAYQGLGVSVGGGGSDHTQGGGGASGSSGGGGLLDMFGGTSMQDFSSQGHNLRSLMEDAAGNGSNPAATNMDMGGGEDYLSAFSDAFGGGQTNAATNAASTSTVGSMSISADGNVNSNAMQNLAGGQPDNTQSGGGNGGLFDLFDATSMMQEFPSTTSANDIGSIAIMGGRAASGEVNDINMNNNNNNNVGSTPAMVPSSNMDGTAGGEGEEGSAAQDAANLANATLPPTTDMTDDFFNDFMVDQDP
ncbi:hypothetical protein HKX48_001044 [Thoreauomyces humboldtii]|nr:hypothetical protein HKX48_001044 [Thoreauomyces humboldtii]